VTQPLHRFHWTDLPAERASVKAARHSASRRLTAWGASAALRGDAVLVLSELVTNAVVHTRSSYILCGIELFTGGRLRIEVHDQDQTTRALPLGTPGPDDEQGRGLLLVEQISSEWGMRPSTLTSGNAVWATLSGSP
jgi:anti-sigma regulatory factor (Ser/Thr protein kinase)